jgi:hypothetical protein
VAIRKCNVFRTTIDRREERIGDVGNDHPDHFRGVTPETACQLAGLISHRLDRFQNTRALRFSNVGGVVEDMRDRTEGTPLPSWQFCAC